MIDVIVQITTPNQFYTIHGLGKSGRLYVYNPVAPRGEEWRLIAESPKIKKLNSGEIIRE